MIKIIKTNSNINQPIFFQSSLGSFNVFFIQQKIKIPKNILIQFTNYNQLSIQGPLGQLNLDIKHSISIFFKNNNILLSFNDYLLKNKKKSILNLYQALIQLKLKGVLQTYKSVLFLKGLGFKANIEQNELILRLGFSHPINVSIPQNIKVTNQLNKIIFSSNDYIALTKYVHFIKNYKKPEPYKGKGLLFKDEKVIFKEGKKSKK